MLNMFIMIPMTSGAGFTAMAALGIGIVVLIIVMISSRIFFGKEFKGN